MTGIIVLGFFALALVFFAVSLTVAISKNIRQGIQNQETLRYNQFENSFDHGGATYSNLA